MLKREARRISVMPKSMLSKKALQEILRANDRLNNYKKKKVDHKIISTKRANQLHSNLKKFKVRRDQSRNWKLIDYTNSSINLKTELSFRPKGMYKSRNNSQKVLKTHQKNLESLDDIATNAQRKMKNLKFLLNKKVLKLSL